MAMLNELILASVLLVEIQFTTALWYEFEFIGCENSNTGFIRTDFRITRKTKSSFSLDGPFEFVDDLDDKYDCEVKLYQSPKGNNQYVLMPYKVARGLCCKLMETIYWSSVQKEIEKVSDMPKRDADKRLCFSYKKGKYTVRGLVFDQNVLPRYLDTGSYKAEIIIYKKDSDEVSSSYSVLARLY